MDSPARAQADAFADGSKSMEAVMTTSEAEFAIVVTLCKEEISGMPPHLSRLLQHAPESFDCQRAGAVARIVREMRGAGEPIDPITVSRHVEAAALKDFMRQIEVTGPVQLDIAEFYGGKVWKSYTARRSTQTLQEALDSLEAAPDKHQAITDNVIRTLEDLKPEAATNGKLTLRTPDELLAMTFDESDIILGDRLLAKGQSLVIAAQGGIGKSRLVLQLVASVVTGKRFLTFTTAGEELRWLILQTENSNRRLQADLDRLKTWLGEDWEAFNDRVVIHTVENDADGFVSLDDLKNVMAVEKAIVEARADVVAIDPLNDFAIGDLNKDADMRQTLAALSRVCRKGKPDRAIVVVHHAGTGRAGAAKATGFDRSSFGRNSKTLHAWTRGQVNLAPVDEDTNDRLVVACGKTSNGREFLPFAIRLNAGMIYECDPSVDVAAWQQEMNGKEAPIMNPDRVRELCKGPTSKADLAKAITDDCGCFRGSAYRYIRRAEQAKKVRFSVKHEHYLPA
ncbi:MAG TPA: AAA family ATPase [Methylomirabilota bacterium]|nr:AAA family ATPase [Methylomirabilota bacterium]